jgi:hypothetical protein
MSKHTLQERLVKGLVVSGRGMHPTKHFGGIRLERIPGPNTRPGMVEKIKSDYPFWFIGPSGGLRTGRNKTNSASLTDTKSYRDVLAAGDAAFEAEARGPAPRLNLAALGLKKD